MRVGVATVNDRRVEQMSDLPAGWARGDEALPMTDAVHQRFGNVHGADSDLHVSTLRAILLDPNVYIEVEDTLLVDGVPSLTDEQLALVRSIVAERS